MSVALYESIAKAVAMISFLFVFCSWLFSLSHIAVCGIFFASVIWWFGTLFRILRFFTSFKRQLAPDFPSTFYGAITLLWCTDFQTKFFVVIHKTRSSPQWWSGRSTTSHDVLNLWSPIYDPSVWGTWGSGWPHSVARPCIPVSSPLAHMAYLLPFLSYLADSKCVSSRPTRIRWQIPL